MEMWEEAPKTEIFGVQVYTFGLYCAIGALFVLAAVCILCGTGKLKKGTGTLLTFLSMLCGVICSRLVYCMLSGVGVDMLPLRFWTDFTTGGWSLFGMIFGVFAGARICAAVTGEKCGDLLDIVSCSVPLFMAAERFGEKYFDLFDISRALTETGFPKNTFLAVADPYYNEVSYLATYLVSAVSCILLFLILVFYLTRVRQSGNLWILFMILCGAGGILLESLRYDHYLEYSFVCFQQVLAAVLLFWGVILAAFRNRSGKRALQISAFVSLPLTIGICIAIEFALDRTDWSHYLLYIAMTAALAVSAVLGILLLRKQERLQ